MGDASNTLGNFGERTVLRELNRHAEARGWGIAVPLAPSFPADILDLRPSGPVFVEVKTTRNPKVKPKLSASERLFSEECRRRGVPMVLAVVVVHRVGTGPKTGETGDRCGPAYSLSYSPVPAVGPRLGPRHPRLRAAVGPPASPTSAPCSALGTATRSGGTTDGTTGGATGRAAPSPSVPREGQ
jgi:hypothetical protein